MGLQWAGKEPTHYKIEYDDSPYGEHLQAIQKQIDQADLLVLFNAKRDLHWLRRYGIQFLTARIWDVQLAHFIITGQEEPYPSLNGVADYYSLGQKDDIVETEYFKKRIDTNEIPLSVLVPYLERDLCLTDACFSKQLGGIDVRGPQYRLINLACIDLLILEEMEWNGLIYDVDQSLALAEQAREEIAALDGLLGDLVGDIPINWNSGDHLSAVLYGGTISTKTRVADGLFKTGKKAGQPKFRLEIVEHKLPQLVKPLPRSELQKEGYWATSEPVLRQLKAYGKAKQIITALLGRAKIEKLVSSYYEGIPKQIREHSWSNNTIHGTLNQCVAATGRLSSSKPNLQNNPKNIDRLFRSRYD